MCVCVSHGSRRAWFGVISSGRTNRSAAHPNTPNPTPPKTKSTQAGTDPVCSLKAYVPSSRLVATSCSGEAGASGAAIVDANSMVRTYVCMYVRWLWAGERVHPYRYVSPSDN